MPGPGLSPNQPLGPPQVLTPPTGWLGLLQMKSGGVQPGPVNPSVSPTLEMQKYYEAGVRARLFQSVAAPVAQNAFVATTSSNQVPAGNVWIIDSIIVTLQQLGVAANVRLGVVVLDPLGTTVEQAFPLNGPFLTGETPIFGIPRPENPLILLPGRLVTAYCSAPAAVTATNCTITAYGDQVKA